jgi:hypothetical protein
MPRERTSKEGSPGADDPRLRWYPEPWRVRYGDELTALLDDAYGSRTPVRIRLSLLSGGLRQRARHVGLSGDTVAATDGIRVGALLVLVAWTAFVIAGASFAKFSEHFDESLPHRISAHRVPDLAFSTLQAVAGVASLLVVVGAILALPSFVRFLRAGGWASVRGHFSRALTSTVATVAVTVPLVVWARHLPADQSSGGIHWVGVVFLVWTALVVITVGLWTVLAVAAGRRVEFSTRLLTMEALLSGAVAVAMVIMVVATAVWWGAMASDAPTFLNGSPAGAPGSRLDLWFIGTVALMAVAMGIAVIGMVRELRLWTTMRAN